MILSLQEEIRKIGNPDQAKNSARFFKTGKGDYGEGDLFLGVPVPEIRKLVKKFGNSGDLSETSQLLDSPYHEERLAGVLTLVVFAQKKKYEKEILAEFYMKSISRINNWDLVDVSSEHILGPYLFEKLTPSERKNFIDRCLKSNHLWTERALILSTFFPIKKGSSKEIQEIAKYFMNHPHDLIHKAVGWMLRESGKRGSKEDLLEFLNTYAVKMPRTMLRYAIEKLTPEERVSYLGKK